MIQNFLTTRSYTILFLIAGLLSLNSTSLYTYKSSDTELDREFDAIYSEAGAQLYNQDDIINTEEFKNASLDTQQDMLQKHFIHKRISAYIASLKRTASYTSAAAIVGLSCYYFKDRLSGITTRLGSYMNQIPTSVGFSGALAFNTELMSIGRSTVQHITTSIDALRKLYFSTQAQGSLERYEVEYVQNKPWIEQKFHAVVEDDLISTHCKTKERSDAIKRIKTILNLPRKAKEISYTGKLINEKLTGYSGEALRNLKRYCIRHVASCREQSVRKTAAYFYGAPGVGKTRAARLIAQVLELPCEVISLGDVIIENLIGTNDYPGLLLEVMGRAKINGQGAKNMIVLFDDADRILLNEAEQDLVSFMLTLLEPETKTFYSAYLGVEIDISSLGIILAGNAELTDEALRNRLHIVHFDGYDADYKKTVVWNELFSSMLAPHKTADFCINEEDFTQPDTDVINTMIEQDPDPGFRSIKLKLMNYLEDKVLCKYFAQDEDLQDCMHHEHGVQLNA